MPPLLLPRKTSSLTRFGCVTQARATATLFAFDEIHPGIMVVDRLNPKWLVRKPKLASFVMICGGARGRAMLSTASFSVFDMAIAIDNDPGVFRNHTLFLQQNRFVGVGAGDQGRHFAAGG